MRLDGGKRGFHVAQVGDRELTRSTRSSTYMSGAGGQTTLIMPSHDLVVVRLGHDNGEDAMGPSLGQAMPLLLAAVPPHEPP